MEKQCKGCHIVYVAKTKRSEYCSVVCKSHYHNSKKDRAVVAEYARNWRRENSEHMRIYEHMRHKNNPEPKRLAAREYNKRKYYTDPVYRERKLSKRFGYINRLEIFIRDGHICHYCGDTNGPFHIDHMTPISRGGKNTQDNLTVACRTCNLCKHTMTAEEFRNACLL